MEKDILELFGSLEIKPNEKWRVVYTKPRQEKKLAQYALEREIHYYLPLIESVRTYPTRKISFWKPLFPSYIFACCDVTKKDILQVSGHVKMFLNVPSETELVDDLRQIYQTMQVGADLQKHDYLEAGIKVKIIDGPFAGVYGYVENSYKKDKVVLQIQMLQKAVSIKVNAKNVQVVKRKKR
jgi:transcription antitermination factor NusG